MKNKIFKLLIPFAFIVGCSFLIPQITSCSHRNNENDTNNIVINNNIDRKYIIESNTNIYEGYLNGQCNPSTYGNEFIDLNKLSIDNENHTSFIIDGTINFGLLIDPDNSNITIDGKNNANVNLGSNDDWINGDATAVLCGTTDDTNASTRNWSIGNLAILKNITFNVFATQDVVGISIFKIKTNSVVWINGTYWIKSKAGSPGGKAYGIMIYECESESQFTIDGIFSITSQQSAYGISIYLTDHNSKQYIEGVFYIFTGSVGNGIELNEQCDGWVEMNNAMFNIESYFAGNLLEFNGSDTINVDLDNTTVTLNSNSTTRSIHIATALTPSNINLYSDRNNIYFSNKEDAGDWIENSGYEIWNDKEVDYNDQTTSGTNLQDIHTSKGEFYWGYAAFIPSSKTIIKDSFQNILNLSSETNYGGGCSSVGIDWINQIIALLHLN